MFLGTEVGQMGKMKVFNCSRCRFIVKSPFGEGDLVGHVRMHVELHHPELAYISKERIGSMVKDE